MHGTVNQDESWVLASEAFNVGGAVALINVGIATIGKDCYIVNKHFEPKEADELT